VAGAQTRRASDLAIERSRETLTDKVAHALVRLIGGGAYPVGARLPSENELADRFGVSRTVVREAVSRLKSESLVESHQGKGVFVRERAAVAAFRIDPESATSVRAVLQVVELRRGLEAEAAALAATRRTRADLASIGRALRDLRRRAGGSDHGAEADRALHRAIARAAGNPHYAALWELVGQFLGGVIRLTRAHEAQHPELAAQVMREHEAMVDAIARREPEEARAAARRHLDMVAIRIASADRAFWDRAAR
jgi:DNA-binding FadR family transcriptional regulator